METAISLQEAPDSRNGQDDHKDPSFVPFPVMILIILKLPCIDELVSLKSSLRFSQLLA